MQQAPKPLSPEVSSAITLASMIASEATGESVTRCHAAIEKYARRARKGGFTDDEIIERLRAAGRPNDPVSHLKWAQLLRQHNPPNTREEVHP